MIAATTATDKPTTIGTTSSTSEIVFDRMHNNNTDKTMNATISTWMSIPLKNASFLANSVDAADTTVESATTFRRQLRRAPDCLELPIEQLYNSKPDSFFEIIINKNCTLCGCRLLLIACKVSYIFAEWKSIIQYLLMTTTVLTMKFALITL